MSNDRLTNNPAETYFQILRNNILHIFKKVKIIERLYLSQYSALTFRNLLSKYQEFYSDQTNSNDANILNVKDIYASQTESNWSEKRSKKKKKSSRTFFDRYSRLFHLNSEQEETIGKIQNKIFEESFNLIHEMAEEGEESPEKKLSLENESSSELDISTEHDDSESKEDSGDENTIENSKYNFLKLNNTGASCYSNCIVQAILSLGANIFNTVRFFFVF